MNAETLRCAVCSKEVRIVRLGPTTLALGHTRLHGPSHRVVLRSPRTCVDCGADRPAGGTHPRRRCQSCQVNFQRADAPRRFWAKLERPDGEDGCWLWPGGVDKDGYGHGRPHRRAYELAVGPIPTDKVVRHTCDVPRCCNPTHLLVGTQAENIADRDARGRTFRGPMDPRHIRRGSASGKAKLTEAAVDEIRELLASKVWTHREIAAMYGLSRTTITAVSRGQNWQHHRVRLSRSAQDQSSRAAMGIPAPTEASEHARGRETPGREVSPAIGPHPRKRSSGGTTAPASEAGLTPATPRVGNAAGRRRSTRRRVSPASAV